MPNFKCKVLTPQGQIVKIKMNEKDRKSCLNNLKRNNMIPISINSYRTLFNIKVNSSSNIYHKKKKMSKFRWDIPFKESVNNDDLIKFTKDFYVLKNAKFTNKDALNIIINNTENKTLKNILCEMVINLDDGIYMYKTMGEHLEIFPFAYVNFIKTGELNGLLEESLGYAIKYLQDEEGLKNKIYKSVLPYVTTSIFIIILLFVAILIGLPLLEETFATSGSSIEVPFILKIISIICETIIKFWYIFVALIILISIFIASYLETENGKAKLDKYKYTNKLTGKIFYLFDFLKVLRCVKINLENKVRLQDSLEISKHLITNTYMLNNIENAINDIYKGNKLWIEEFEYDNKLNSIIIEILRKNSNNNLKDSLEKVIQYVTYDIEQESNKLIKLLPRITYAIVGISLLIFAIFILIPSLQVYLSGFLFI